MRRPYAIAIIAGTVFLSVLLFAPLTTVFAELKIKSFATSLSGFEEVPSLFTSGVGKFKGKLNNDQTQLTYELSYSSLEGNVTQAHIHFAQRRLVGNIMVFLCTNLDHDPTGLSPSCPDTSDGKVEGTLAAANVVAIPSQKFPANGFDMFLSALRAVAGYVNVHTNTFGSGEIGGQVAKSLLGLLFGQ